MASTVKVGPAAPITFAISLVLLAGCSSSGADENATATTTPIPIASGSSPIGATDGRCEPDPRFDDDPEFAVAVCEVNLALEGDGGTVSEVSERVQAAIERYDENREAALDLLYELSDELFAADGE